MADLRVSVRNARFQQWQALLGNRSRRHRAGEFLVQGVRPINLAIEHGWPIRALLYDDGARLSRWADGLLRETPTTTVAMGSDLLAELGGRTEGVPELVAVVGIPPDDLTRIPMDERSMMVVFDRPTSPGNIGTLVRSADAFGAAGVVVTGHAADVYDPQAVRASTGSLFAMPTVRVATHQEVLDRVDALRAGGLPVRVFGTDETGTVDVFAEDLTGPVVLLIGNETNGLSAAWRAACDRMLRIPITGAASSLNAATAATVCLYEARRQRLGTG
jgi:TrmH family RNA methyltransferase